MFSKSGETHCFDDAEKNSRTLPPHRLEGFSVAVTRPFGHAVGLTTPPQCGIGSRIKLMKMKKTASKTPAKKSSAKVKDLKPKKNPKGGILIGLLVPAVQKVRAKP